MGTTLVQTAFSCTLCVDVYGYVTAYEIRLTWAMYINWEVPQRLMK